MVLKESNETAGVQTLPTPTEEEKPPPNLPHVEGGPASAQKSSYTTTEEGKQPPKFPPLRLGSSDLHVRMQPSIFLPTIIFVPTVAGRKRWQESKCAEVVRDLYCVMQQYHRTRSLLETRVTETSMALSHEQNE